MAKSAAKKKLDHFARQMQNEESFFDPRDKRGNWNGVNPVTRSIPNKRKRFLEKVAKEEGLEW